MTHLLPQIHFEKKFFLATKNDLRERKKLFIGLICQKKSFLKIFSAGKTKYNTKNGADEIQVKK